MKIAVGSGKGGTGKTFFSVNLYHSLIARGIESVLTDCDAEAPDSALFFDVTMQSEKIITKQVPVIDADACTFCGRCYDYCYYGAIFYIPEAGIIRVLDDLCHSCGACSVACNFHSISEKPVETGHVTIFGNSARVKIVEARMRIGAMTPVPVIKAAVAEAAKNGYHAILDAPPGTSCPFVHTVSSADYIILVTEPTPFGMSDLKQSVETVKKIGKPFGVVINKAGLGDLQVYEYLRQNAIPLLMEIPYDKEIAELTSQGKKMAEFRPEWIDRLAAMFSKIEKEYGNSNHQR
jgi:MinD superfamily P-loop ATPase